MWTESAPANLALIKYMGKIPGNRPVNTSFSYTMSHLITEVSLEIHDGPSDEWQPLEKPGFEVHLSDSGRDRYLQFFAVLKKEFGLPGNFIIRSANNFPADCGLASSASSFAALTKAAFQARGQSAPDWSLRDLSALSRRGSGSSCRSFYAPFAVWRDEFAEEVILPYPEWIHQVMVVDEKQKKVATSDAHKRVNSSLLFEGRADRAERRLESLFAALQSENWALAYEITWAEFQDMHSLFETSQPAFGYMTGRTLEVLRVVRKMWETDADGPLVTMDAGPNVHLLYRQDQQDLALRMRRIIEPMMKVFGNDTKIV